MRVQLIFFVLSTVPPRAARNLADCLALQERHALISTSIRLHPIAYCLLAIASYHSVLQISPVSDASRTLQLGTLPAALNAFVSAGLRALPWPLVPNAYLAGYHWVDTTKLPVSYDAATEAHGGGPSFSSFKSVYVAILALLSVHCFFFSHQRRPAGTARKEHSVRQVHSES